jgi:CRISPR-associated protein Cas2
MGERLYIFIYDISDAKRWRAIYRLMKGYGLWLQLSVFQCRLSKKRHTELIGRIKEIMDQHEDHVVSFDLGQLTKPGKTVVSLGKKFEPVKRQAIIV